ncbi:hypothetical protein ABZ474_56685, partial [Streptomyces mirabilis]
MPAKPLATDFDADGIRVNCVVPSIVDTPMSRADLWRIGELARRVHGFGQGPEVVQSRVAPAQHLPGRG